MGENFFGLAQQGSVLYNAVKSAAVSKEIISLFTDKYRLPNIQSSLISIRVETASLNKEVSLVKAPTFLVLRLISLWTRTKEFYRAE